MWTIFPTVNLQLLLFAVLLYLSCCDARRYRTCQEGCCVHEYCAYHRICYPRIHCGLGCPDGHCVGQGTSSADDDPQPRVVRSPFDHSLGTRNSAGDNQVPFQEGVISERYSHNEHPLKKDGVVSNSETLDGDSSRGKQSGVDFDTQWSNGVSGDPRQHEGKTTDGICMPHPPCHKGDHCEMGHTCSFNYNLGYHTCQYNLEIGSTLCYDSKGNSAMKTLS